MRLKLIPSFLRYMEAEVKMTCGHRSISVHLAKMTAH